MNPQDLSGQAATGNTQRTLLSGGDPGAYLSLSRSLAGNVGQSTPDDPHAVANSVMSLLQKYQQLGQGTMDAGTAEQAKRGMAQTDPSLIGASPSLQAAVRNSQVNALNPTIGGAKDVLDQAQNLYQSFLGQQEKAKADARSLISNALLNFGSDASDYIPPETWKLAGYSPDAAMHMKQTLKQQQMNSKYQRVGTDALGNPVYQQTGNIIGSHNNSGNSGSTPTSSSSKGSIIPSGISASALSTPKKFVSSGNSIIDQNVMGIMNGTIPPPSASSGNSANSKAAMALKAALQRNGVDLSKLTLEWQATQAYTKTANSSQQVRLKQAISSVRQGIEGLRQVNDQWNRSGLTPLNAGQLQLALSGSLGDQAQGLAAQFQQQATIIQDELGQTFMGGNSPTDKALGLAGQVFSTSWSQATLNKALTNLDTNLSYRETSIDTPQVGGLGGDTSNPYAPTAPAQNNRIQVKSPNGQVGTIPAYQLQDALSQGYTQVQ